ncbi:hypothetical protein NLJ89_g10882 [Agrocybe chaxingu]|uniref:Uncharacterized protein n=1 Tax=Agrocybe chaxingu TaxID=84603 RepID=A0A9W8JXU0_9AGAR|nr:hypothetical protein NLJ89_g10882 [Agrocybe chaxingu]
MSVSPSPPVPQVRPKHNRMFDVPEHRLMLVEGSPFHLLVAFAGISKMFRSIAQDIVYRRFHRALAHFLPEISIPIFLKFLDITKSGISSDVPLSILMPDVFRTTSPRHLVIQAPCDKGWEWLLVLFRMGYTDSQVVNDADFIRLQVGKVACTWRVTRPELDDQIFIIEGAQQNILVSLTASHFTSEMNVITSTAIYSLYPALTEARIGLPTFSRIKTTDTEAYSKLQLTLLDNLADFGRPCGASCMGIWRYTRDLAFVGRFHWQLGFDDDNMEDDDYQWRLHRECVNLKCRNAFKVVRGL